jgi:hypothetical protein
MSVTSYFKQQQSKYTHQKLQWQEKKNILPMKMWEKNHFSKFYIDGKKQLCQLQKNNFIPRLCLKLTSSWGLEVKETSFSPWYMF